GGVVDAGGEARLAPVGGRGEGKPGLKGWGGIPEDLLSLRGAGPARLNVPSLSSLPRSSLLSVLPPRALPEAGKGSASGLHVGAVVGRGRARARRRVRGRGRRR